MAKSKNRVHSSPTPAQQVQREGRLIRIKKPRTLGHREIRGRTVQSLIWTRKVLTGAAAKFYAVICNYDNLPYPHEMKFYCYAGKE